jgi:hypothetical protein
MLISAMKINFANPSDNKKELGNEIIPKNLKEQFLRTENLGRE